MKKSMTKPAKNLNDKDWYASIKRFKSPAAALEGLRNPLTAAKNKLSLAYETA